MPLILTQQNRWELHSAKILTRGNSK